MANPDGWMMTEKEPTSRRKAREMAMCCAFEIEVGGQDPEEAIERTIEEQEITGPSREFIRNWVRLVSEKREAIDELIRELAVGWTLERMAKVDLAILRLAIAELLIGLEEPAPADAVIINEAIVLAKKFSTPDSGRFVNGILANVVKGKENYSARVRGDENRPEDE